MKKKFLLSLIILMSCFAIIICNQSGTNLLFLKQKLYAHQSSNVNLALIDSGVSLKNANKCAAIINFSNSKDVYDYAMHGTYMFDIIKSKKYGVAPECNLYSLKVTDDNGKCEVDNVIKAVEWCINNKINIISLSFSTTTDNNELHNVIKIAHKQGIHIFSAVSNESCFPSYPAGYDEVIGIYSWRKMPFYDKYNYMYIPYNKFYLEKKLLEIQHQQHYVPVYQHIFYPIIIKII